jgi:hypothetical protein
MTTEKMGCPVHDVSSVLLKAKFLIKLPVGHGARARTRLDRLTDDKYEKVLVHPQAETAYLPRKGGAEPPTTAGLGQMAHSGYHVCLPGPTWYSPTASPGYYVYQERHPNPLGPTLNGEGCFLCRLQKSVNVALNDGGTAFHS